MNLTDGDEVIGMQMQSQGDALMIVSEKGLGKCTLISEFTTQNRGGKGVKCYKITEKTSLLGEVKYTRIVGDAADSPIVLDKAQPSIRLGITRTLNFGF